MRTHARAGFGAYDSGASFIGARADQPPKAFCTIATIFFAESLVRPFFVA